MMLMARRTRHGRTQVDREGISALTGASGSTIAHWKRHRATTRFPVKAATDQDGRDWWWLDEIKKFWRDHLAARAATFTEVDRRGDPDDLLSAPESAKVLGYRNHRSLPDVLLDQPDHVERLPSGRLRRYWHRRTLWDYADGRPLRHSTGRPPGTLALHRQPHSYAADPRLPVAIQLVTQARRAGTATRSLGPALARRLGINARTAQRLLAAANASIGSVAEQAESVPAPSPDKPWRRSAG
jgi:hypothetical protein